MASETWNFSCDWRVGLGEDEGGFGPGATGTHARISNGASGYLNPFTDAITVIFAFRIRSKIDGNGTSDAGESQSLIAIGDYNTAAGSFESGRNHGFLIQLFHRRSGVGSGTSELQVFASDRTGLNPTRHNAIYGDEDGSSWLQMDKWYQMAISASASGVQVALNGSTTLTNTVTTSAPGNLNLQANDQLLLNSLATGNLAWPINNLGGQFGHRSFITGPVLFDDAAIDLSDAATLARIYDADGNFKNPGQNGSLWLGDAYDDRVPLIYLPDGWIRRDFGRGGYTYNENSDNNDGEYGGLRKDYE